jgi:hypothetical protein
MGVILLNLWVTSLYRSRPGLLIQFLRQRDMLPTLTLRVEGGLLQSFDLRVL